MILILDQAVTVLGDADRHKLADDTAKISRHQKAFEARHSLCIKLLIDEAQKTNQVLHRMINMFWFEAIGEHAVRIEKIEIHLYRATGF